MSGVTYSPADLARCWKTRTERVKALIERHQLKAFDLTPTGPRRNYRVTDEARREYESGQTSVKPTRQKKRIPVTNVKEFF